MKKYLIVGIFAVLAFGGCGYVKDAVNPVHSITSDVKDDTHLMRQIQVLYPDATNVRETNTENNPNYVSFDVGQKHCTAFVSSTKTRYATAGSLITEPFCIPIVR